MDPGRKPRDPLPGADEVRRLTDTSTARLAGLGVQFAFVLVLFGAAGYGLDVWLGTRPWLLVVGVFAGGAAAFYSLLRALPAASKRPRDPARKTDTPP